MKDFNYRFKLKDEYTSQPDINSLEDFYKHQIKELLDIVVLYDGEKPVRVDSFSFIKDQKKQIKLYE